MSSQNVDLKEIWPGQSRDLLKSLHILTPQGSLNQDSRRKLKQVQHLVQLITPHLGGLTSLADLGAGKSYLGLMLYDLYLRGRSDMHLYAIEQRRELVEATRKIAASSGFTRVTFVASSIRDAIDAAPGVASAAGASAPAAEPAPVAKTPWKMESTPGAFGGKPADASELPSQIDAVTALHACDTATDEAIAFAIKKQAKFIALVPCCQAEVARLLDEAGARDPLVRHALHRREFGSHLTNVIRSLYLESLGYKVRVTELIGWEHSMKNELILAEKIQRGNKQARRQLDALLERYPIAMKLFELAPLPDLNGAPQD